MKVASLSGQTAHFTRLKKVYLLQGEGFRACKVERAVVAGNDVLLKLSGVNDPETGKALRGVEVWAEREDACPLESGEYYVADICGCRVESAGQIVGRVRAVCQGGASDLLEVELAGGGTAMVPFVEAHVGEVDTAGKRILLKEELGAT